MKLPLRSFALTGALLSLPCISVASDFFESGNPKLAKVHSAYLTRDFKAMAIEIKNTLMAAPHDPQIKKNVFAVLKKAYESRGQEGIPADWSLPEEITKMKVSVRLSQNEFPEYSLNVYGNIVQKHIIKQMKVTRYPNQVVIDKKAGIGDWEEEEPARPGEDPEYIFRTRKNKKAIPSGLYLLRVELTNGKSVDGWFLLEDELNSTAAPDVTTPAFGETFQTGNPTLRWVDFRSPQYKPYERRSVWMGISRSEPPKYDWDLKWDMFVDSPTIREATVGVFPKGTEDATGINKLENGRYVFIIKYNERRRFGDILIGRDSSTMRPFVVQQ